MRAASLIACIALAALSPTTSVAGAARPATAPPGYSTLVFSDKFTGTTLNASKWNTYLGAEGIRWDNKGDLPAPYSADNSVANGGSGNNAEMYAPSQVSVNDGLTLTATPNTNEYAGTYPWLSGVVTTEGKFSMPSAGWYLKVRAKMPDTTQGIWPAIWFLCGTSCTDDNELDGYGGGFLGPNPTNEQGMSDFFSDQGQQQALWSTGGADVSAGFHTYGIKFNPGQGITAYFDGTQVWKVNASDGVTIAAEPYELILELQVASANTSGWHATVNGTTPTSSEQISSVKVYEKDAP